MQGTITLCKAQSQRGPLDLRNRNTTTIRVDSDSISTLQNRGTMHVLTLAVSDIPQTQYHYVQHFSEGCRSSKGVYIFAILFLNLDKRRYQRFSQVVNFDASSAV